MEYGNPKLIRFLIVEIEDDISAFVQACQRGLNN
jgi:hypothetical protein